MIDMQPILLHVEFEGGLYILILVKGATRSKIYNWKRKSTWKKSTVFKPRPPTLFYPHPRFFKLVHVRVSKVTGAYLKE
jgi:hypothetical protein